MKKKGIFTGILTIAVSLMLAGGVIAAQTEYCKDLDDDGYGDPTDCERVWEEGYVDNGGDCNDVLSEGGDSIYPGQIEVCGDGIDNNCINGIDEGCDGGNRQYYYHDADDDDDGDPTDFEYVVNSSPGYIEDADPNDCDDGNWAINSTATEICSTTDLTDENCSGAANEGCQSWWQDADNDGYSTGSNLYDMSAPAGYVLESSLASTTVLDCNDNPANGASINPAATEICSTTDLTDENCSGAANEGCQSWWQDADNDAYTTGNTLYDMSAPAGYVLEASLASTTIWDCNDSNTAIKPTASEICSTTDLTDENCSGAPNEGCQSWWQDADNDAYSTGSNLYDMSAPADYVLEASLVSTTVWDCNDDPLNGGASINPGVQEIGGDQIDQNCDGDNGPYFPDPNLEACILEYTGGDYGEAAVADLAIVFCKSRAITDLTGIEYITGARQLIFDYNSLTELPTLSSADLPNLEVLTLNNNSISNLAPLAGLSGLIHLQADRNSINSLAGMEGLTGLTGFTLRYNSIIDITPLANLTGLTYIYLTNNLVSDLTPLTNLTFLNFLQLDGNSISSLAGLENHYRIRTLGLNSNSITDISPLASLTWLDNLQISRNSITDITPLASISKLFRLGMSYNAITDIAPLASHPNLYSLSLSANAISDLTPLANLIGLQYLYLGVNSINDLTGLENLSALRDLRIGGNAITDLSPLANLQAPWLRMLILTSNTISDLTPLSHFTALTELHMSNNAISDLSQLDWANDLPILRYLNLSYNCINDFSPVSHVQYLYGMDLQCM